MILSYTAREGQSIYDVCLQTYGDIKYLFTKLIPDNNISNINSSGFQGRAFIFDSDYISDHSLYNRNQDENVFYVTANVTPVVFSKEDIETIFISEDGTEFFIPE